MPIKRILRQDDAFELLDATCASGGTWTAGGCLILARALHEMIPGAEIWAVMGRIDPSRTIERLDYPSKPHHAVVKVGNKFLDADGWSTEEQLIHRWEDEEGLLDVELVPAQVQSFGEDIPNEDPAVEKTKKFLQERSPYLQKVTQQSGLQGKRRKNMATKTAKHTDHPLWAAWVKSIRSHGKAPPILDILEIAKGKNMDRDEAYTEVLRDVGATLNRHARDLGSIPAAITRTSREYGLDPRLIKTAFYADGSLADTFGVDVPREKKHSDHHADLLGMLEAMSEVDWPTAQSTMLGHCGKLKIKSRDALESAIRRSNGHDEVRGAILEIKAGRNASVTRDVPEGALKPLGVPWANEALIDRCRLASRAGLLGLEVTSGGIEVHGTWQGFRMAGVAVKDPEATGEVMRDVRTAGYKTRGGTVWKLPDGRRLATIAVIAPAAWAQKLAAELKVTRGLQDVVVADQEGALWSREAGGLGPTAKKLLLQATENARGALSVNSMVGKGPKGGKVRYGHRAWEAARKLVDAGLLTYEGHDKAEEVRKGNKVEVHTAHYTITDEGREAVGRARDASLDEAPDELLEDVGLKREAAGALEKIQADPRVDRISDERRMGDGIWVYLKHGYEAPSTETRTIHEYNLKAVIKELKQVYEVPGEDVDLTAERNFFQHTGPAPQDEGDPEIGIDDEPGDHRFPLAGLAEEEVGIDDLGYIED